MTNFKGTKGKWVFDGGCITTGIDPRDETIAIIDVEDDQYPSVYGRSKIESRANALLISKAPEMLAMLESSVLAFQLLGFEEPQGIKELIKEATELE